MSGLVKKIKEMWNPVEENEEESLVEESGNYDIFSPKNKLSGESSKSKVLDLNSAKNSRSKIVLSRPERFGEEIKNIADELLKMHAVVLNLELTPKADAKRLIDFLSGVAYAIDGKIKKSHGLLRPPHDGGGVHRRGAHYPGDEKPGRDPPKGGPDFRIGGPSPGACRPLSP